MNQLVVVLLVILLPGIIAAVIADSLTIHSKWDSFRYGLYSLILGTGAYLGLQLLMWFADFLRNGYANHHDWTTLLVWTAVLSGNASGVSWIEIFFASLVAVPVAMLASWLVNHKVFNKLGQRLGVTTKYGDENLFSYYLNAEEIDWIYLRDARANLTYQGRVISNSENDSIQEIVLGDVSVYRYEDSAYLYSVPTLYIAREMGQFVIEAIPPQFLETQK